MYKCGYAYEQNVTNASDKTSSEKKENFKRIFERFDQFITIKDPKISQRVRLLIKNLFTEKKNKWETSRSQHEKGLMTKGKVQKEVEEKAMKEQQQRYDGNKGGDRRDRYNQGGGRNDGNYNDNRKGGGGRDAAHNRKKSEYNGFGNDKPKQ